ncbi:universal stress protein [Streptomyces sp. N2-109]|uniref:Universal stress protein n=1 Tax=Streptomyces gossypii TaxID=2883101 RepID=A0ABT2JUP1_9ACTN|nr:universal stress protein [Streptomyces gossypii]MCT2591606.1 universal stress protein [Streptomyces gossypii]
MSPTIVAGLDGSSESRTAVLWAAREAVRREGTLRIIQVHDNTAYPYGPIVDERAAREWCERNVEEAAADLAHRLPDLRTSPEMHLGRPRDVLPDMSADSELLVLGSRGLGTVLGFIVGSVALPVVAHAPCPVVLVRSQKTKGDEPPVGTGPVVLGLKPDQPMEDLVPFAFRTAARWSVALHVVHVWHLPSSYGPIGTSSKVAEELNEEKTEVLRRVLRPWHERFPTVELDCRATIGRPARHLVHAAPDASMVVVGRRKRTTPIGPHIGSVTHAVMHHSKVPVAAVPYR